MSKMRKVSYILKACDDPQQSIEWTMPESGGCFTCSPQDSLMVVNKTIFFIIKLYVSNSVFVCYKGVIC